MNTHLSNVSTDPPSRQTRPSHWSGSLLGYSSIGLALGGLALISLLCTDQADSKEPVQVAFRPDASSAANLAQATLAAADAPAGVFKGVVTFKGGTPPAPKLVFA